MGLPSEKKTEDFFEIIVTSVLKFGNASLIKRLFVDTRWQNEWLYSTTDELDMDTKLGITAKENILCKAFGQSANHIAVFKAASELMNDNICFSSLADRLGYAEHKAWQQLNSAEHRYLYESTGNVNELYHTFDIEYIKSEIEKNKDLSLEESLSLLNPRYMDCCKFYLGEICPRLAESGKSKKILGRKVLFDIIGNHDIQRLLLKSPVFETYKTEILETFYTIPDKDVCQEYLDYILNNRSSLFKDNGLSNILASFKVCTKVDDTHKLFQLCGSSYEEGFNIKEAILNSVPNESECEVIFFHKYKFYKEHLAKIPDDRYIRDIHDNVLDGKIIGISEMSGIYTVYTSVEKYITGDSPKVLRGDYLHIGNDTIKIRKASYKSKTYIGAISNINLTKVHVEITPKKTIHNKVLDVTQLPMYRKSELENLEEKQLNQIDNQNLINFGLIGYTTPKKM